MHSSGEYSGFAYFSLQFSKIVVVVPDIEVFADHARSFAKMNDYVIIVTNVGFINYIIEITSYIDVFFDC